MIYLVGEFEPNAVAPLRIPRLLTRLCDTSGRQFVLDVATSANTRQPHGIFRLLGSGKTESDAAASEESMGLITRTRFRVIRPSTSMSAVLPQPPARRAPFGRLIRLALGLYLLPVLLAVLVVGGVGMLVVAGGRLIATPHSKSTSQ
jgi:hypothetical protein